MNARTQTKSAELKTGFAQGDRFKRIEIGGLCFRRLSGRKTNEHAAHSEGRAFQKLTTRDCHRHLVGIDFKVLWLQQVKHRLSKRATAREQSRRYLVGVYETSLGLLR